MIVQPLGTSSNPKHLLQALDLCLDMGAGVPFHPRPHIPRQQEDAGWVVLHSDMDPFPTPKSKSPCGLELQSSAECLASS